MGDIGPERFYILGKKFSLEMMISDKLGNLDNDELVITLEKE